LCLRIWRGVSQPNLVGIDETRALALMPVPARPGDPLVARDPGDPGTKAGLVAQRIGRSKAFRKVF